MNRCWILFILALGVHCFNQQYTLGWTLPVRISDQTTVPFDAYAELNTGINHVVAGADGLLYYLRKERNMNFSITKLDIKDYAKTARIIASNNDTGICIVAMVQVDSINVLLFSESHDKGLTWSEFRMASPEKRNVIEGPIELISNETVNRLYLFYNAEGKSAVFITKSKGSMTWSQEKIMYQHPDKEILFFGALAAPTEKKQYLFSYFQVGEALYLTSSDNNGVTWKDPEPVMDYGRDFHILFANMKLYLIYDTGAANYVRFSENLGESWSAERYMTRFYEQRNGTTIAFKSYKRYPIIGFWTTAIINFVDSGDNGFKEVNTPWTKLKSMKVAVEMNSTSLRPMFHCYIGMDDGFLYYSNQTLVV